MKLYTLAARTLFQLATETWGAIAQERVAYEELGEAMTAIARYGRGRISVEDLVDEIADARIMLAQVEHNVATAEGIALEEFADKVENRIGHKLERLQKRLSKAGDS